MNEQMLEEQRNRKFQRPTVAVATYAGIVVESRAWDAMEQRAKPLSYNLKECFWRPLPLQLRQPQQDHSTHRRTFVVVVEAG